jgi:ribosomal protein L29
MDQFWVTMGALSVPLATVVIGSFTLRNRAAIDTVMILKTAIDTLRAELTDARTTVSTTRDEMKTMASRLDDCHGECSTLRRQIARLLASTLGGDSLC